MEDPETTTNQDTNPGERPEKKAPFSEIVILFLVMAIVLIVDQWTKHIVETWLPLNTTWAPIPGLASIFRVSHVANTGAAFGLFPTGSAIFTVVAILVAVFIVVYNFRLPAHHVLYRVALGLMLGGALGNLIDRLRQNHVTDFMDFGPWPVFNVADFCVVSGVIILAILMLREQWQEVQQERSRSEAAEKTGHSSEQAEDRNVFVND